MSHRDLRVLEAHEQACEVVLRESLCEACELVKRFGLFSGSSGGSAGRRAQI